ncbi:MAG: co-chaperone DjlA [Cellvibrionaceae bacterium]|nr:co-chaperone DjlA [Cellvibrionaceae bacterium]
MGKMIGGLLGFYSMGVFGGLLGLLIGHVFDSALRQYKENESPEALQAIKTTFFSTTFTLIGFLAKADGRVSQEEIDQTQQLMDKMGLTADHKREAIRLFKMGSAEDFKPEATLAEFKTVCGHKRQLRQMLIVYLINTALADGRFDQREESALIKIAEGLHFSHLAFDQLLRMLRAQSEFTGSHRHRHKPNQQGAPAEIKQAYAALGVNASASHAEIKKAYRKLMSEYHPDKLMGQGVPEDMIKLATERSQEVQMAYDVIKKAQKNNTQ